MVAILNELRRKRRTRWVHLSIFQKPPLRQFWQFQAAFFQVGEKAAEPSEQSIVANN